MRERIERQLANARRERDHERKRRESLQCREEALVQEMESAEAALTRLLHADESQAKPPPNLGGMTVLYVGGRAHQVARLRGLAEQSNVAILHHDGGVDERSGLLEARGRTARYSRSTASATTPLLPSSA